MPPVGTAKADQDTAAAAKAKAVATLQRLFFEEMSKGGQDASGAAARALLRLSEAPQQEPESTPEMREKPVVHMVPPPEVEVQAEAPVPETNASALEPQRQLGDSSSSVLSQQISALGSRPIVPRRPSENTNGLRRPRVLSRVAVRS